MINSLYIAVTGMSAFSNQIGVCGNNVANMETTGYKASSVSFADMLAESVYRSGGSNAGCGVTVQSVSESWTQGTITDAASDTSLAINGRGMFVVKNPNTGQQYYTRDGAFEFDKTGRLVYNDTMLVQGYSLDESGNVGALGSITVSAATAPPKASTEFSLTFNLDSGEETAGAFETTIDVYDSLGNDIPVTIEYTKSATANEWTWTASIPSEYGSVSAGGSGTLTFDTSGNLTSGTDPSLTLTLTNGAASQTLTWDMYDDAGAATGDITQHDLDSALTASEQDGYGAGELTSIEIDDEGQVVCTYSNDVTRTPYVIALADFPNYGGLNKTDGNLYAATNQSGQAVFGRPDRGRMGSVCGASTEASNVDLSQEMTKLITSQTAYQACSKAFSVTNELLQVLVNMK
jgi:flagellar hook protein FlgE